MLEKDWYNSENWSNEKISYDQNKNVMFFDTNEEYEEAFISFPVPKNAQSFSLSFKIGNSYPSRKIGCQDRANITVGFGYGGVEGETKGTATPNIIGEEKFVKYSLGTEENPIGIVGEPECFYFQVTAHNADSDNMEVYFGDFDLCFYDREGAVQFAGYVPFIKQQTSEKVFIGEDMALTLIFRVLLFIFILGSSFGFIKKKREKNRAKRNKGTESAS